jgi:sucrose-phosphate synthase
MTTPEKRGFRIALISLHGLIRGENLELGRDADTGGQTKYVVELLRALGEQDQVEAVELITRQVIDHKVSPDYAQVEEVVSDKCRIVRIPFGPRRYLHKESLWPHIESFVDQTMHYFRRMERIPDVIHGHYAESGYAGGQLANLLGIPFVFTGHSLGKVKKQRLMEGGISAAKLEEKYRLTPRIEAEEFSLETAGMVITSTLQEIEEQYKIYDHYQPERMEVIPPGVDLKKLQDVELGAEDCAVVRRAKEFLLEPNKPVILAIARPDERKNFETLIATYGESEELQDKANLVLIAGNRIDIREFEPEQRRVLLNILTLIDRYDLYGKVAYPKRHSSEEIPLMYKWAASTKGVFVNPALTEPFGLTLLEAAISGLPMVATNDGGPRDILAACKNGELVDPLDREGIANAILRIICNTRDWDRLAENGIQGVLNNYSWEVHAKKYLRNLDDLLGERRPERFTWGRSASKLPKTDRIIITDIDNTLTGDDEALRDFVQILEASPPNVGFGIATGRKRDDALDLLQGLGVPQPDLLITCVGTEIYYGRKLTQDASWRKQIRYEWKPDQVRQVLADLPGVSPQADESQSPFKVSYQIDPKVSPSFAKIRKLLRENGVRTKLILSFGIFLDCIPIRAGDGLAIRHLAFRWGLPPEHLLIVGDSGNDAEMLTGNTLGVVVGNYSKELEPLRRRPRLYFAQRHHAGAIIEGIEYYHFMDQIVIPNDSV